MQDFESLKNQAKQLDSQHRLMLIEFLIATLPKDTLTKAVAVVRGHAATSSSPVNTPDPRRLEAFYSALAETAKRHLSTSSAPVSEYLKRSKGAVLREASESVDAFITECFGSHLRLRDRILIYQLYAKLMAEYLIEINAPISINSMLNTHRRFPGVLNRAFPGYLQSKEGKQLLLGRLRGVGG